MTYFFCYLETYNEARLHLREAQDTSNLDSDKEKSSRQKWAKCTFADNDENVNKSEISSYSNVKAPPKVPPGLQKNALTKEIGMLLRNNL